jgi:hypothetical protein
VPVSKALIVGGIAGIVMVMTTGWLITGYCFHRFQKLTPATWRPESWRQHVLAVGWAALGGMAIGALDARAFGAHDWKSAMGFAGLTWAALAAPVIATLATYVNLHRAVVFGLLLEWLVFVVGVSLACSRWA